MSSTPLVWLRRFFDVTCAVLGLMLLVLLGPWMLCRAINSPTPQIAQLVRVSSAVRECRPTLAGLRVSLRGYANSFQIPLDACGALQPAGTHEAIVVLNVVSWELMRGNANSTVRTFGLEVQNVVVRPIGEDLKTARLDRAIMSVTGCAGTAVLLCITWILATRRGSIRSLLTGEHF
jgi:hypothetical protein